MNSIALKFGINAPTINKHIIYGHDEMEFLSQLSGEKYPRIARHKIWSFMDGFKSNLQRPNDELIQNCNYSGYVGQHCVNNVVLFDILGKIRFCKLAQPGKTPDSVAASRGGYYSKAKAAFDAGGYNCITDSAFRLGFGTLATTNRMLNFAAYPRDFVSIRQSAEWGMKIMQQWRRLSLPASHFKRRCYLNLVVVAHLCNFINQNNLPNQIRTVMGSEFFESLGNHYGFDMFDNE